MEAGNKRGAVTTLERVNFIYLRDDKGHQKLGDLYMELGNPSGAIREYGAVLAMKPVDQAGSHFQLAKALQAANGPPKRREEVFSALEAAPSYKPAQKLLLELSATDTNVKQ